MSKAALAFLVATLPGGWSQAAELAFKPVPVAGPGPLLFLVHPEDEEKSGSNGRRTEVLYLYDPHSPKPPQRIWEGGNPRPHPVALLQPGLLALDYKDRAYVLRLDSGVVSSLLPGEEQSMVIHVEGSKLLILKRTVPDTSTGYKLTRQGDPSVIVLKDYYRPRDYLYRFDPAAPAPVLLVNVPLEKVLTVESNAVWAITAGANRKLCRISMAGRIDEITAVDEHWVAPEIRMAFSPGRTFLALVALHDEHDFHGERELVVIQLAQKRVVYAKERVSMSGLGLGDSVPQLPVRWLGESVLSTDDFAQVQVDVEKGTRLPEAEAAKLRESSGTPNEPERKRRGFFDHEFGRLYFLGEKQPVAEVLDHRKIQVTGLAMSPKGDWAAFVSPQDNNTYLVDGRNKKKTLLMPGWSYDLNWLP